MIVVLSYDRVWKSYRLATSFVVILTVLYNNVYEVK